MKYIISILLVLCCFFIQPVKSQVSANDPNESNITDNRDFGNATLTYSRGRILAEIDFYDDPDLANGTAGKQFWFYFSTDNNTVADYMVTCEKTQFDIRAMNGGSPGPQIHSGRANLGRQGYSIKFPVNTLGLASGEYLFRCWFYWVPDASYVSDRLPNTGSFIDLKVEIP